MDQAHAYMMLESALQRASDTPPEQLIARIGSPGSAETIFMNKQPAELEISVEWQDQAKRTVRIFAELFGPNTVGFDRCSESLVIQL